MCIFDEYADISFRSNVVKVRKEPVSIYSSITRALPIIINYFYLGYETIFVVMAILF